MDKPKVHPFSDYSRFGANENKLLIFFVGAKKVIFHW